MFVWKGPGPKPRKVQSPIVWSSTQAQNKLPTPKTTTRGGDGEGNKEMYIWSEFDDIDFHFCHPLEQCALIIL